MNTATDYQELLKRVKASMPSMKDWKDKFGSIERTEASQFSKFYYGEPLEKRKGCGCVDDFLNTLKFITFDHIKIKLKNNMSNFKLKPGKLISIDSADYTDANMTDENAIKILKRSPGLIVYFSEKPSDWRDLVGKPNTVDPNQDAKGQREAELAKKKKPAIRKLADKVAKDKSIDKAHASCGVPGLTRFILDNE